MGIFMGKLFLSSFKTSFLYTFVFKNVISMGIAIRNRKFVIKVMLRVTFIENILLKKLLEIRYF